MNQGDDRSVKKTYSKPTLVKSPSSLQGLAAKLLHYGVGVPAPDTAE